MNAWPVLRSCDEGHLLRVAMPLGGVGTGTVSIGGRGDLRDWEIMNRPAKGFVPTFGRGAGPFLAIRFGGPGRTGRARLLEGPLDPFEYDGDHGSRAVNHGLPRFRRCRFDAAYPLAAVRLGDPDVPLDVRLEAFNPMAPCDAEASGLPVAILRCRVANPGDGDLDVSVCATLPNFIGVDGSRPEKGEATGARRNRNRARDGAGARGVFMDSQGVDPTDPAWGTIALATPDEAELSRREEWAREVRWGESLLDFWDDFAEDGRIDERRSGSDMPVASLALRRRVKAGAEAAFTFLVAWHFPNRRTWTPCGCETRPAGPDPDVIGNWYCTRFGDAWAVAERVARDLASLEDRTVSFVRALVESDLPPEIKEAALFNASTLRTQTCFRTPDGRLYGFEGVSDRRGCCHGSCTHVWNYEQATAFLFGDLARSMREVELAHATDETGCMSFRVNLPLARATEFGKAAADGQMGCIMKLHREWQLSGDGEFLRSLWPHARRALEFAWIEGGWDGDRDGVMEGCQHNTMDVEYYGPNPQMTGWYLGALRAAEEMARHVGETAFAGECRRLFESGSRWMDERLWNGDYYEHEVRPPADPAAVPGCLRVGMGGDGLASPDYQLGTGCLVDQLVGQCAAHVLGLGYLHDPEKVRRALQSIARMNRVEGFHGRMNPMRSYALGDETALVMATYPEGRRPARPFPYYGEAMTGFEYTAAVGMLQEGLEEEGLRTIRDVRARYDGLRRNPFDEAECGRHYARAMAGWAAVLAWTGLRYSAVARTLDLAPREGRFFWSTGCGWGTYRLARDGGGWDLALEVYEGRIAVEEARVGGERPGRFAVTRRGGHGRGQRPSGTGGK